MMSVALNERNVYENFDQESDVLYFKLGSQGLVSFHGRNYNRKKRMTAEELRSLTNEKNYFQISSDCFINLSKIRSISDGTVYFGSQNSDAKQLHVNRRKQYAIEQVFQQFSQTK
ncbi:LytTR family transcriptional regulator DNA-binding domain-containing protein [Paenibacillus sp. LHD-117]|uniref:LytTR family transcriptional regulator DNA-binding domain-containing protein n=1 Tax=Paenibacillus sp. LHD-117 TaxID=3071412 RepID=UPI0027DF3D47|nr:LytTR family transcriptional regulator DNA-binding domain-containing protein [Paenibacillus sp. LHD-117]MDQ6421203.1 LytTR family transcriptional regulator DNA-binding domain-containing protein [Paenibacillus sp. LHD-117]